jgi:hypothetical protein
MAPKVWTVEVTPPAETQKGESPVRRHYAARNGLSETPNPAIRTLYDLVQFNAVRHGDQKCFGTRKVVKIHNETTTVTKIVDGTRKSVEKAWMFWELGPFEYRSYKQAAKEGLNLGAGLVKLGLEKGDKVAVYADTSYDLLIYITDIRAHWQLIAQGTFYEDVINSSCFFSVYAYCYCLCDSRRRRSHSFSQRNRGKSNLSRSSTYLLTPCPH